MLAWTPAAPALAASAVTVPPAPAMREGVGTATEYRHGAPIKSTATGSVLISPLRIVLRSLPGLPLPGDKATISLTVSNAGAAALTGVKPVLAFVSGSSYAGPLQGPVPPAPVTLNPNGGLTFVWTVTLGGTGSIAVRAVVTATVTGQGVVSATAERALAPPALPRLSASLSPNPLGITGGQWFDVVVTVSNTGGVRAMQILPALMPSTNASLVVFQRGPKPAKPVALEPGESARFAFTYSANGSGTVSFNTTVTGQADLTPPGLASRAMVSAGETADSLSLRLQAARAAVAAKIDRLLNPPQPPPPTERAFMTFETPDDLTWETDGFAMLALSSTHMTEGEHACAVTFSVPGDLTLTPTGAFKPAIRLVWPPRGLEHALDPRDWTPFRSFRADCYNDSGNPVALSFTLVDHRGRQYDALRTISAGTATRLEYGFPAIRDTGVDIEHLSMLQFAVDTTGLTARPVLYFDNLRFELPPPPPLKRHALSSTTMLSSSPMTSSTRTPTGSPTSPR